MYCITVWYKVIMSLSENNIMQHEKVAVVTGSSSGIGFKTSLLLARNGFYTYATMKNPL